jgi:hypothetical protein
MHSLYTVAMFLLALILSCINIEVIIPSKRRREDRGNKAGSNSDKKFRKIVKFLKHGLTAVIGLSLLELGIPVSFSALSKHKLLIAYGLLLFSAPWDLLLHNPAKEAVQTASHFCRCCYGLYAFS